MLLQLPDPVQTGWPVKHPISVRCLRVVAAVADSGELCASQTGLNECMVPAFRRPNDANRCEAGEVTVNRESRFPEIME
jgi:hypothetical protein